MAEFAIALPILLLIILGLIETGRLIFIYAGVVTSSREAARYGSAQGLIDKDSIYFKYQDCAGIRETAESVAFLIPPSDLTITIEYDAPGTTYYQECEDTDGDGIDKGIVVSPHPVYDPDTGEVIQKVPKRITITSTASYSPIIPIIPQFTINNITTSSSRTYLTPIEFSPE